MSQINFLPETYARMARRRRRKYRHLVLLSIFAVGLVGWGFVERGKNVMPRLRAAELEAQVEAARYQMSEFIRLREERDLLVKQQRIKQDLAQPISHTQVITALDAHLPDSIGLTDLQITTVRPAPEPINKGGSGAKAKKKSGKNQPVINELQIEFEAFAPDDVTIANLIGELSEDTLFDRVTLKYSRTTDARGIEGRLFKLLMRVRLDRRFEPEVAHAD